MKEEERVDQDEVWSAIRYLDPDEKDKDRIGSVGTVVAVLALLIIVSRSGREAPRFACARSELVRRNQVRVTEQRPRRRSPL